MARSGIVDVDIVIIDSTELFLPGGDVYDWIKSVTREVSTNARLLCPGPGGTGRSKRRATTRYVPTGRLKASIKGTATVAGVRQDVGTVTVGPTYDPTDKGHHDYSLYVTGGTAASGTRYIYSRRGYANKAIIDSVITRRGVRGLGGAHVEDMPGYWRMVFRTDGGKHFRVHGQKRNPFLFLAFNRVGRKHPAIGQIRLPYNT